MHVKRKLFPFVILKCLNSKSRIFEANAVHSLLSLMMKGILNIYVLLARVAPCSVCKLC